MFYRRRKITLWARSSCQFGWCGVIEEEGAAVVTLYGPYLRCDRARRSIRPLVSIFFRGTCLYPCEVPERLDSVLAKTG